MTNIGRTRRTGTLATIALAASLGAGTASATTISEIYVFGDSLSDSGNIFTTFGGLVPRAPYVDGRFTNGPNWVDNLAGMFGLALENSLDGGTNYAYGGARTGSGSFPPSLLAQTQTYLTATGNVADPDALYVVWGGGNDVRDNNVASSAGNIASIITDLAAAGATRFLVPNLPDIGLTPESLANMAPGGPAPVMTQATLDHNAALASQIALLSAALPVDIIALDVFALFNDLIGNPTAFGFSNVTDACFEGELGAGGDGDLCSNPDDYVFFDGIHPTAAAHALLADYAFAAVAPIPVPAALPLFLSGLSLLGIAARRRRAA